MPSLTPPTAGDFTMITTPPTFREMANVLHKTRNKSAPGPNGIPYLIYKKCPKTSMLLHRLFIKFWNEKKIP